jgi:hypothetical protein
MSAPLVINLRDGSVWERRAMSRAGVALYALAGTCACPEFVMASEPELAELGIAGSADALPMPVGPEPRTEVERLAKQLVELQEELHTARFDGARARRERDVIRERVSEPFGCAHCGVTQRSHGRRYLTGAGMHGWERPSEEQVKDRMLARRAARIPVGSAPVSEAELDSAVEELSAFLRVRLALESAKRGRRELRAELHTAQAHGRTFLEQRNAVFATNSELLAKVEESGQARLLAENEARAVKRQFAEAAAEVARLVQERGQRMKLEHALRDQIAELEAAQGTAYRAEHPDSGITLGHYSTAKAARAHCEETERRSWPDGTTLAFDWIEDDEDRVAELVVTAGQNEESVTGYIVTALELDSEYDAEAAE